ncbi:MAG: tetratricopeptide repeat protein [Bacteroidota bacterium]
MANSQHRAHPAGGRTSFSAWCKRHAGALCLFVLVASVYSLWAGNEFIYDDHNMVNNQTGLYSLSDLGRVFSEPHDPVLPYYRPVTRTTFLLQKAWHGDNPLPFHLFNALLIGLAAVVLHLLLRLPVFAVPEVLALLAAALFALHPVASSSVYPIASGRETLLPAFFMMAAIYSFLRPGRGWYILATVFLTLAIFSKEQAVVLAALFVLADALGVSADAPGRSVRRWLSRYWLIGGVYLVYFLLRFRLFAGREFHLSLADNPAVPLLSPVYALQSIVAPFLALVYEPMSVKAWLSPPRVALAALAVLLLGLAVRKQWPASRRMALFWGGWFLLAMLPTSGLVAQDVHFEERYIFLSAAAAAGIGACVAASWWRDPSRRRLITVLGAILIAACGACTVNRGRYFRDDLVFYQQWLRTSPDYFLPHHAMGTILYKRGRAEEAAAYYRKAIAMKPDWPDSHLNLGLILVDQGKYGEAEEEMLAYVRLKPQSAKAHYSLGVVQTLSGKFSQAIGQYEEALALEPHMAEAHHNLGCIYQQLEQYEKAADHYREALKINPGKANSRQNLEDVSALLGKP